MAPEMDEEIALDAGMPVTSANGETLGELETVLVDEESEEADFIVVKSADKRKLVPFETIIDVEDDTVVLDLERADFDRLPGASMERDPTEDEIELAYRVVGLSEED